MLKTGDWVQVAEPSLCCGDTTACGRVFKIERMAVLSGECRHCGAYMDIEVATDGAYKYDTHRLVVQAKLTEKLASLE